MKQVGNVTAFTATSAAGFALPPPFFHFSLSSLHRFSSQDKHMEEKNPTLSHLISLSLSLPLWHPAWLYILFCSIRRPPSDLFQNLLSPLLHNFRFFFFFDPCSFPEVSLFCLCVFVIFIFLGDILLLKQARDHLGLAFSFHFPSFFFFFPSLNCMGKASHTICMARDYQGGQGAECTYLSIASCEDVESHPCKREISDSLLFLFFFFAA